MPRLQNASFQHRAHPAVSTPLLQQLCRPVGRLRIGGGEKQSLEQDDETRMLDRNVSYFIEKYARRRKKDAQGTPAETQEASGQSEGGTSSSTQDLSLEQGGLLLQLAMRVRFMSEHNFPSKYDTSSHCLRRCS